MQTYQSIKVKLAGLWGLSGLKCEFAHQNSCILCAARLLWPSGGLIWTDPGGIFDSLSEGLRK